MCCCSSTTSSASPRSKFRKAHIHFARFASPAMTCHLLATLLATLLTHPLYRCGSLSLWLCLSRSLCRRARRCRLCWDVSRPLSVTRFVVFHAHMHLRGHWTVLGVSCRTIGQKLAVGRPLTRCLFCFSLCLLLFLSFLVTSADPRHRSWCAAGAYYHHQEGFDYLRAGHLRAGRRSD